MEDRRRGDRLAGPPAAAGLGRRQPLALGQLAGHHRRLERGPPRPLEEEEAVVEALRTEGRGEPAAGEHQPRGVGGEAEVADHLGEGALAGDHLTPRLGEAAGRGDRSGGPPRQQLLGEQHAGLLEQLADGAGEHARHQVGLGVLDPVEHGFGEGIGRRGPLDQPLRHPLDRHRDVGPGQPAAGEGVPAAHEGEGRRPGAPSRPPPRRRRRRLAGRLPPAATAPPRPRAAAAWAPAGPPSRPRPGLARTDWIRSRLRFPLPGALVVSGKKRPRRSGAGGGMREKETVLVGLASHPCLRSSAPGCLGPGRRRTRRPPTRGRRSRRRRRRRSATRPAGGRGRGGGGSGGRRARSPRCRRRSG